jgi:hypothetical protein
LLFGAPWYDRPMVEIEIDAVRREVAEVHGRLTHLRSLVDRRSCPEPWRELDIAITKLESLKRYLGDTTDLPPTA